jgi:hypothetical protein
MCKVLFCYNNENKKAFKQSKHKTATFYPVGTGGGLFPLG